MPSHQDKHIAQSNGLNRFKLSFHLTQSMMPENSAKRQLNAEMNNTSIIIKYIYSLLMNRELWMHYA